MKDLIYIQSPQGPPEVNRRNSVKLKMLTCLLALGFNSMHAAAQSTLSFAGATWGESLQTTNEKLKAAGFSGCAFIEVMACKAAVKCHCSFTGPSISSGTASYTNNRLDGFNLYGINWVETKHVLEAKYKAYLLPPEPVAPGQYEFQVPSNFLSKSGESIRLEPDGFLSYNSPALNARLKAKDAAQKSAF